MYEKRESFQVYRIVSWDFWFWGLEDKEKFEAFGSKKSALWADMNWYMQTTEDSFRRYKQKRHFLRSAFLNGRVRCADSQRR